MYVYMYSAIMYLYGYLYIDIYISKKTYCTIHLPFNCIIFIL